MKHLIDTGVLLRCFDEADPHCPAIREAFRRLRRRGDTLHISVQNAAEFWNVSTRPASARGGYGQSNEATDRRLDFVERFAVLLTETSASYAVWRKLLVDASISGVAVHDARLVSVMIDQGIESLITLNAADFDRYDGVRAQTPDWFVTQR